ncbi:hypothetical protein V1525DRAFT_208508 [Lipomyces kononenkoae]|uniref:Uncharacterized protein n=1 Tax=Lipomyces kononenkoae TaxID=34357 RepID=A0ACC3T9V2_LIPKO
MVISSKVTSSIFFQVIGDGLAPNDFEKIIRHRTSLSRVLHCQGITTHELRQALVAFLDQYAGHDKAVAVLQDNYAHDIQSGRSSRMAVTHYAISSQDLPSTNRYVLQVSERWFRFLGEDAPAHVSDPWLQTTTPSEVGQSVERPPDEASRPKWFYFTIVPSRNCAQPTLETFYFFTYLFETLTRCMGFSRQLLLVKGIFADTELRMRVFTSGLVPLKRSVFGKELDETCFAIVTSRSNQGYRGVTHQYKTGECLIFHQIGDFAAKQ